MLTRKMPDLRDAVIKEMKRQDVTAYRLIQMLKGKRPGGKNVPDATIYDFIRGDSTINSADLGLIFDALGMTVK